MTTARPESENKLLAATLARCADVLAFPQARRVHLVEKTAARVARAESREQGEKLLAAAVCKQLAAMKRKQISAAGVERECRALESAIRAHVWRLILTPPTPGGAA